MKTSKKCNSNTVSKKTSKTAKSAKIVKPKQSKLAKGMTTLKVIPSKPMRVGAVKTKKAKIEDVSSFSTHRAGLQIHVRVDRSKKRVDAVLQSVVRCPFIRLGRRMRVPAIHAIAKCSPKDKFDVKSGIKIAVDRVIRQTFGHYKDLAYRYLLSLDGSMESYFGSRKVE